jgi:diguanylate cyclase (GGDEF)-like protein/PAS domain S-box-containing protein
VAADRDQPRLRSALVRLIANGQTRIHFGREHEIPAAWIDANNASTSVVAAAIACTVADSGPSGALVAWRSAPTPEPFTDGELLLLDTLADYAAVAIETTRLFDEAVSRRDEAEEREQRIQAVMENVADGLLTFDAAGSVKSANPAAERIFGRSATALTGLTVSQLMPELADWPNNMASMRAGSTEVTKREVSCARPNGTLLPLEVSITGIRQAEPARFIAVVRDVSERRAFEQQLRHMAFHDPLTGLPNRALFMDRIEHALSVANEQSRSVGVLFLDLDNFKVVNDSLGHAIGDELLVKIATRLRERLGSSTTLARFGGDEFTVLLEDHSHPVTPEAVAEILRSTMEEPFKVADHEVFATLSVGIAVSTPGVESAGDLLRNADVAMYRAKAGGRARAVVFDRGVDSTAVDRWELETELRGALERGELELYYQPIIDLTTAEIRDFEALIRWNHPHDGLVSPDRFISVAEETGLIIPIGQWVLETACLQLKSWHRQLGSDDMSVSINISARQFQHPGLVSDIARVLRMTDLPARCLTIEITESLAMRDAAAAAAVLGDLKKLGVGVAIDDFGTGYSSLSYLHRFPCDVLKIDRSFVSRLGGDHHEHAIVEAIVALAHALDMQVTAEGIETGEQLARLSALGCEQGQGYYFSRPVPAHAAIDLLAPVSATPMFELPRAA